MIKYLTALSIALIFSVFLGCTSSRPVARYDDFDQAEIAQLRGNYVSGKVFGKTVLALNPRRETRLIEFVTNTVVLLQTNQVTTVVTNLIVTISTNFTSALSTNDNPIPQVITNAATAAESSETTQETAPDPAQPAVADSLTNTTAAASNQVVVVIVPPPPLTNQTVTSGLNVSSLKGNNQLTETAQRIEGLARQISVVTTNQTITTQFNEIVTTETNRSLSILTNQVITAVTNISVIKANLLVHDYYLFTELIAPPEFNLSSGESLVLLIDDERFAFSQTSSPAAFSGRKRFVSTLYKVPEQVISKIGDAQLVRVRLRGQNAVIERELPKSAQQLFKQFFEALVQKSEEPPVTQKPELNSPPESAAATPAALQSKS